MQLAYFHGFSVFLWTSENDWNTIRQLEPGKSALGTRLTVNTCGPAYNFENGEKNLRFQKKISGYEWTGPYLRNHTKKRCYVAVREYFV